MESITKRQHDRLLTYAAQMTCKTCLHMWQCIERDRMYPCREYVEVKIAK